MKYKINNKSNGPLYITEKDLIKENANCPMSEKTGTGPGSCGGNTNTSSGKTEFNISNTKKESPTKTPISAKKPESLTWKKENGYGEMGMDEDDIHDMASSILQSGNGMMRKAGASSGGQLQKDPAKWEKFKGMVEKSLSNRFGIGKGEGILMPAVIGRILEDNNFHSEAKAIKELGLFEEDPWSKNGDAQFKEYRRTKKSEY